MPERTLPALSISDPSNYCFLGKPLDALGVCFRVFLMRNFGYYFVEASWNVMAHAQKPDFVFRRNGRVHLNRRGRQFSRLLAAEVCASAVVMLDTPCSVVMWRVLDTHSIRQFPLHFPSRGSPCAITFHLESTANLREPCQWRGRSNCMRLRCIVAAAGW